MNSGFRRYTGIGSEGAPPADGPTRKKTYEKERGQFGDTRPIILGYAAHGSGASVAIFDYGYFGGDDDGGGGGKRGGGASSGGGYKLISDSKQAPSPMPNMFGGK